MPASVVIGATTMGQSAISAGKRHRSNGANDQQSTPICGSAPRSTGIATLSTAVGKRRVVELSCLLTEKADPNEADAQGETPLFKAASRGDAAMAFLLLEARADPSQKSLDGRTAIDVAQGTPVSTLLRAFVPTTDSTSADAVEAAQEVLPNDLRKRCHDLAQECGQKVKADRCPCRQENMLLAVEAEDEGDEVSGVAAEMSSAMCSAPVSVALEDYIPADMDNTLEDLLFRDITPEDYDMLLQLDEDLARATASSSSIDSLEEMDPEELVGQKCVICQCSFDGEAAAGHQPVLLRCQHAFHRECIKKWLLERSEVCPLCGDKAF